MCIRDRPSPAPPSWTRPAIGSRSTTEGPTPSSAWPTDSCPRSSSSYGRGPDRHLAEEFIHALRALRRRAARVRHHASRHSASVDQLPRQRGILRDHLEYGGRVLLLPRRPAPPADALSVQQRAAGCGWPVRLPPRRRLGRLLEPQLAADPARAGGLRLPSWPRLLHHLLAVPGHQRRDALLRPGGRDPGDLAGPADQRRAEPAKLSLFSSIEFCLWDAQDDATNFQRNYSVGEVEVEDGVIYHKTEYRERRDHFAFFACSEPLAGFDTQRDAFLGPYRSWDRPIAVERGASSNSIAHGWQPSGSHHVRLEIDPGETKEVILSLI